MEAWLGPAREVALVALVFGLIVGYSLVPRLGELVGALFDRNGRDGR
jgi:hypothetical protein